ncbi:hypothetical protein B296_00049842 [Ensete ventricosum]|uniref:Uncharacterized protein n=1 Tax=Ensete ventricosum TaxID=4639 RepID=A0A426Y180_ENSVE|nr:hypothetical protein B296_00049842 [Ensete ventricosum]
MAVVATNGTLRAPPIFIAAFVVQKWVANNVAREVIVLRVVKWAFYDPYSGTQNGPLVSLPGHTCTTLLADFKYITCSIRPDPRVSRAEILGVDSIWAIFPDLSGGPRRTETSEVKRSKVELFKEKSNFLRYPLNEELTSEAPNINEAATQLIKFHGSYQQTNRDERGVKSYQFMLRTKNPCGKVPNRLYLVMDDLAGEFGTGTLRLTTRQTFQLHGILKKNLKTVMSTIIKNMGSTLGACGDLNRNVLAPAAPYTKKEYVFAQETAENIAALLTPQAGAYYDLWVDGEKIMSAEPPEVVKARNDNTHGTNFPDSPEPIYGIQFLPRKFKIAVTVPTDNSVDILTNDIGVVVVSDIDGEPQGFNIYVMDFTSGYVRDNGFLFFLQVGIENNESVVIRVTGCPNGCARPYMAELGLVGDGPNSYQVWLGGTPNQTSLAKCFTNKVKVQNLEKVLEPLFCSWKGKRLQGESFGSFTTRIVSIRFHLADTTNYQILLVKFVNIISLLFCRVLINCKSWSISGRVHSRQHSSLISSCGW